MPLYLDIMRAGVRYLKVAGTCPLFSSSRALRYIPSSTFRGRTKNKKIGWGLYQTMTLSGITTAAADVVAPSKSKPTITNAAIDSDNPLLRSWSDQPFNLPPFKDIRTENFVPAFEVAMAAHKPTSRRSRPPRWTISTPSWGRTITPVRSCPGSPPSLVVTPRV